MGYVGNQTTNAYTSMDKQDITGNGGASYTLSHAVANAQEIEVFVNNVRQEAGVAYTTNGTALNMTGNVASSDDFYVVYQGKAVGTIVPPDGSVTDAKITAMAASKLTGSVASTAMPTGSVIQVQQTIGSTSVQNISSTSYVDTGLSIDITPRDANSKFLVQGAMDIDVDANEQTFFTVFRDSTDLGSTNGLVNVWNGTNRMIVPVTILVLDAPSTASQITYKIRVKVAGGTSRLNSQGTKVIMTVSEIAG